MASTLATVICIFSTKGGVGRTAIAANLSVAFGLQGYRTVLLDMDLHTGGVDQVLALTPEKTFDDLIQNEGYTKAVDYLTTFNDNLRVLAAPARPDPALRFDSVAAIEILSGLRHHADIVVVDLPAPFANHVVGALEAADLIGLVTTNDILSVKNAVFALQNMALLGYDLQTVRLIVNRFDPRGLTLDEVKTSIGLPIWRCFSRDNNLLESLNKSKPLVLDKPRSPWGMEIKRLALSLAIEYGRVRAA